MEISLNPLWIYTTLKHIPSLCHIPDSLNPLWIYTTLKPVSYLSASLEV